ncbi:farnesyl pyrophosphate synthase 1-like [Spodoptera litura]|uniref:Farnesyl pyrophosphate synthase n=1 Tax=Spodoptera litura TaxID=69820 RepID=A0A9J7J2U7_SPOLT|nr:farnesyl pyrophosphate synthase 1-like [Spodoptera litura]
MNNIKFLRLLSRTRSVWAGYDKHPCFLQLSATRTMQTGVSISQIMKEKEVFHDVLPGIIENLQASTKISQQPEVAGWVKQVLEHNLSGGKHSRGLITMLSYEMLEKPESITDEKLKLSRVLGWCVEMLQAYFIVADDIMDGSTTRRGMPCWYRMPNVGLGAINDSILIYCSIMETLDTYLGKTPHFVNVVKLFNEALTYTSMGQHLDYTTANHKKDYSLFTVDRYASIVKYKTSCYTFRLPILLGLSLVQDVDKAIYPDVNDICMKLGHLFQMQDDYIDCYGDETITGKAGTDIQEGKCSWLAVTALKHCNEAQRAMFAQYYGRKEPEHVAIIKRLYDELRLPEIYREEETLVYDNIMNKVRSLPSETAPVFFYKLIDRIYKRKH